MVPLLTPTEVAAVLGVRDLRTVRRELARLGVPVVAVSRSYRVRSADLDAAIERAARVETGSEAPGLTTRPRSVRSKYGQARPGWWRQALSSAVDSGDAS